MAKLETKHLQVDGMTCSHCEKTIANNVQKLVGVQKVKASLASKLVSVRYDTSKIEEKDIIKAIEEAGYVVVNKKNSKLLFFVIFIIITLLMIDNHTNVFKYVPTMDMNMGYGLLFITGLLTSIHCVAMCGGINLSVVASRKEKKLMSGLMYNLGRVISYTVIGGIVGGLGSVISLNPDVRNLISILVGATMFLLGLKMLGIFPKLSLSFPIPNIFKKTLGNFKNNVSSPFAIGLVNGLMPCGPLQTMQVYALGTGTIYLGALSMFIFALGTVPLMMGLSLISGLLTAKMSVNIKKASAIFIIILGVIMFNRGFDLSSIIPNQNNFKGKDVTIATIKDGYQEVRVRFTSGRYKPIVVQKDIPVKWIIEIKNGDLNGCNNSIYIKSFDISEYLEYGDNIVEFVPTEVGTLPYTCWMNMIRSYIYVVDDIKAIEK